VPAPKQNFTSSIWLIVAGLVVIAALGLFSGGNNNASGSNVIPYSRFQQYLTANKVKEVTVSGNLIRGTLNEKMPDGRTDFTTVQVPPDLASQLAQHKVEYSGSSTDTGALGTLLSWILPPLLFVGIWMFASRAMTGGRGGVGGFGGGLLSVGRSRAKLVAETDVKVTFSDVAGVDEANCTKSSIS
jgi:cell division protease FtsH